jgi:hypothetical protein
MASNKELAGNGWVMVGGGGSELMGASTGIGGRRSGMAKIGGVCMRLALGVLKRPATQWCEHSANPRQKRSGAHQFALPALPSTAHNQVHGHLSHLPYVGTDGEDGAAAPMGVGKQQSGGVNAWARQWPTGPLLWQGALRLQGSMRKGLVALLLLLLSCMIRDEDAKKKKKRKTHLYIFVLKKVGRVVKELG